MQLNKIEDKKSFANTNKQLKINNINNNKLIKTDQNKIAEILNNFIDEYYKGKLKGKNLP